MFTGRPGPAMRHPTLRQALQLRLLVRLPTPTFHRERGVRPMNKVQSFRDKPVVRGFLGKCPACGKGNMFRKFLKVADQCPACGEELYHHRADDFPAYLVIVIVGHIVVAGTLAVEAAYGWPF